MTKVKSEVMESVELEATDSKPTKMEKTPTYEEALKLPLLKFPKESKVVTILRKNSTRVPNDVFKDAITKIGSEWKADTRSIIRGLNHEEEIAYLPKILGLSASSPQWDSAVELYWEDFSIRVPNEGVKLEIWTDQYGRPSESNLKDYIMYRFCQQSSKVATSAAELENAAVFPYFVQDDAKNTMDKHQRIQVMKKASLEHMKLFKADNAGNVNMNKINWVLEIYKRTDTTLGLLNRMPVEEKEVYLYEKSKDKPEEFLNIVEDPSLEHKAFISECIGASILTRIGNVILNGEEKLGDTLEEAVLYLTNPKNSKMMITLSERLKVSSESIKTF